MLVIKERRPRSQVAEGHDHCYRNLYALIYTLSPIDLVRGFFVPGLGQLDDATSLALAAYLFIRWSPPEVVAQHTASIGPDFLSKFRPWLWRSAH